MSKNRNLKDSQNEQFIEAAVKLSIDGGSLKKERESGRAGERENFPFSIFQGSFFICH